MLKNYLTIAWRNLRNNGVFSFINIFGLAVGLGCCMLIVLYLYNELHFDAYHKDADRLYQVGTVFNFGGKEQRFPASPAVLAQNMRHDFPEVEGAARMVTFNFFGEYKTLLQYTERDGSVRSFYETKGCAADSCFFKLMAYRFVEGDGLTAMNSPNSVVISKEVAMKLFGSVPALNKVIHISSTLNGDHDCLVRGVFEPGNRASHLDGSFFISFYGGGIEERIKSDGDGMTFDNLYTTYLLLKRGVNARGLEAKFPAFVDKYAGKDMKQAGLSRTLFLLPVRDIHLHADMMEMTPSGSVTYMYILGSIAVFILLIACINFMNLSTARSYKRASEVGVRKVLGAARSSLVWQFLGESVLMSLISLVFALGMLQLLLPVFEKLSGVNFGMSGYSYAGMLGFFLVLAIVTGVLASSYPAFYLSSFKPVRVLKGKLSQSWSAAAIRKGLVVFQFMISIILMVSTVVISGQMRFLRSADLGFAKDRQIVIPMQSETSKKIYLSFKNELLKDKQVLSVGGAAYYPGIVNGGDDNFHKDGQDVHEGQRVRLNRVDESFLQTLEIKPVAGRLFSREYISSDTNDHMILNEEAVRRIGFSSTADAIGKNLYAVYKGMASTSKIVGVVKDFHFEDLHVPVAPYGFYLSHTNRFNYAIVHVGPGDIGKLLKSIEGVWRGLDPGEPMAYSFLDAEFQKNYLADARLSAMVDDFTVIAILISCLGLFGLAAFMAEQRSKEISIRKVLGASVGGLVRLLSKDFLRLVVIAIVIASPVAWVVMVRWLRNFTVHISIGWVVFAVVAGVAMGMAFATISVQTIRAALAKPVKNLRSE